ncbi:hypothetical protein CB1_001192001 [Camelus ferus]|nr:hypothetical protein CB1_001192001 [Camelus ferus]
MRSDVLTDGPLWTDLQNAILGRKTVVCRVVSLVLTSQNQLTAKAVAVLLPILGTSWVFGVLAVNSQAVVFQYMFAILNSLQVRAAFKHKTKVWSLTSSSARHANVKPFSSDIMNGTRPGTGSTKLCPWDTEQPPCHSAHRVDLSAV